MLHEQRGMRKLPRASLQPLQVGPELWKAGLCTASPGLSGKAGKGRLRLGSSWAPPAGPTALLPRARLSWLGWGRATPSCGPERLWGPVGAACAELGSDSSRGSSKPVGPCPASSVSDTPTAPRSCMSIPRERMEMKVWAFSRIRGKKTTLCLGKEQCSGRIPFSCPVVHGEGRGPFLLPGFGWQQEDVGWFVHHCQHPLTLPAGTGAGLAAAGRLPHSCAEGQGPGWGLVQGSQGPPRPVLLFVSPAPGTPWAQTPWDEQGTPATSPHTAPSPELAFPSPPNAPRGCGCTETSRPGPAYGSERAGARISTGRRTP